MYPFIIALFFGISTYFLILSLSPISEKDQVKHRVNRLIQTDLMGDVYDRVSKGRSQTQKRDKSKHMLLISKEFSNAVMASGIKLKANEFLFAWVGITFLPMSLVVIFGGNMITAIGFGILGFTLPPFVLNRASKKRQSLFTLQLGEALLIIGNSLKGGFSLRQAMESIAKDMMPPISSEFEIALREMRFGVDMNEALKHMTERVKNRDLELFISAVLTSAEVGSNLSEILETISATIRDRIRIRQEVKVLTSSGRLSAIITGLLPVFLMLVIMILNPNYFMSFVDSRIGQLMLLISIILEIIGFIVIRKIADIQF